MKKRVACFMICLALLLVIAPARTANAAQAITTDSRIKTLVYSANDVFTVTTHYGYQSNIEFGEKETIETISMGDRVAWQISPAGRRLFIRAQEENAYTNMTVVTNLRAYQFDLRSSSANAVFGSEELTYVVRFYYPDDMASGAPMPMAAYAPPSSPPAPVPTYTMPVSTGTIPLVSANPAYNYRYTYSGPSTLAPVKIYDDGKSTYFKFAGGIVPKVAILTARGETVTIATQRTADGLIAVNAVAPRFSLTQGGEQVIVYNEAGGVL